MSKDIIEGIARIFQRKTINFISENLVDILGGNEGRIISEGFIFARASGANLALFCRRRHNPVRVAIGQSQRFDQSLPCMQTDVRAKFRLD